MKIPIIAVLLLLALVGVILWRVYQRPPHALGCVPSTWESGAVAIAEAPAGDLPETVDMRGLFTPRNQGGQSSCVGFAVSAAIGEMLSPAFIYNQRSTGNCKRDAGMSLLNALSLAQSKGDCLELLHPYDPGDACTQPDAAAIADAATRKIGGYALVGNPASLDAIRAHLAAGNPVLIGAAIHASFFDNASGAIPAHIGNERYYGGHAMLLVGYDSGGFWALNSWGPTWGHDGFAYLSNEFMRADVWEAWVVTGLLSAPTTLFVDVIDGAGQFVLGGSLTLVRDGVETVTKSNVGGTVQFDTRTPGRYCVKPLPPTGYASDTQVECLTTGDRLRFVWRKVPTPTPTWTLTPTRTAVPTWTATPTVKPLPTIHPTGEPPMPPTPDDAPQWAVVSWWGQWGLVGERQPTGLQFLQVPREHWPVIRRAVYLAQGGALPQYDTWGASKLGYAMAQAELGAVLTPPVVVECGDADYLCVGTAAGILVVVN